jgi:hypothetical protein
MYGLALCLPSVGQLLENDRPAIKNKKPCRGFIRQGFLFY